VLHIQSYSFFVSISRTISASPSVHAAATQIPLFFKYFIGTGREKGAYTFKGKQIVLLNNSTAATEDAKNEVSCTQIRKKEINRSVALLSLFHTQGAPLTKKNPLNLASRAKTH
jgi:hypothetical protein